MGFCRVGRTAADKVMPLDALAREAFETVPDFNVVPCNGPEPQTAEETKEHGMHASVGQP